MHAITTQRAHIAAPRSSRAPRALRRWYGMALLLLGAALLAACGGGGNSSATAISAQPVDQSVVEGSTATFVVAANNATGYQWQRSTDGGTSFSDVPGATGASYTTPAAALPDTGTRYRVLVSGAGTSVTSSAATLTVTAAVVPPAIVVQPGDQNTSVGQDASFSVTASGTSLSYQWQRSTNGGTIFADLTGANNATLTRTAVTLADNGHLFRVMVSNSAGSATSNAALLTVSAALSAPAITTQPASASVVAPDAATFTVAVTGVPTPSLQWQLSADGGATFSNIAGATASSYTTAATAAGDSGQQYRVIATNGSGAATSNAATLTVTTPAQPAFTTQPANASTSVGQTTQFTVAVSGTPTPTLQWQLSTDSGASWSNITGATATTLSIVAPALSDNGRQYRAVASNSAGNATSNVATLSVTAGKTWLAATRVNAAPYGDVYDPKIAYDSAGNAMAVWMQTDVGSNRYDLWANRYVAGTGWGTPLKIYSNTTTQTPVQRPQLGVAADGSALVVWELAETNTSFAPTHIWSMAYAPGSGWGVATRIDDDTGAFRSSAPQLAVAANGTAVAAWSHGDGSSLTSVRMQRGSTSGGFTGSPTVLASGPLSQGVFTPVVALNSTGHGAVIWQRFDGSNTALHASLLSAGSAAGDQVIATTNANGFANTRLAVNTAGAAVVVWGQFNGTRFDIVANRRDPATGWDTPTQLSSASAPANTLRPDIQLHLDDAGSATALWDQGNATPPSKVWSRLSAAGWGTAQVVTTNAGAYRLASNAAGQLIGTRFVGQTLYATPNYVTLTADWFAGSTALASAAYVPLEMAMSSTGKALVVWVQAEAGGGYGLWASEYR